MSTKGETSARWLPLESNPDVINKYVSNMGVSTDQYEFVDIYGLDPELLQLVPKPVLAVLLLFPITKEYGEYRNKQIEAAKASGQKVSENLFFTRQTVQNACGTVGIIHSLANNKDVLNIDSDKAFAKYLKATETMTPEQSAEYLKQDEDITSAHSESANEGQTEAPSVDQDVDLHFIAFVSKDGHLYELDGAKEIPLNHGPCQSDELLEKTAEVVKKLMALNPEENRFNLIGLAARS